MKQAVFFLYAGKKKKDSNVRGACRVVDKRYPEISISEYDWGARTGFPFWYNCSQRPSGEPCSKPAFPPHSQFEERQDVMVGFKVTGEMSQSHAKHGLRVFLHIEPNFRFTSKPFSSPSFYAIHCS
jgi:hypothetical protein